MPEPITEQEIREWLGPRPVYEHVARALFLYYCDERAWTHATIAEDIGRSRGRIGQLLNQGLRLLRHPSRWRPLRTRYAASQRLYVALFGVRPEEDHRLVR